MDKKKSPDRKPASKPTEEDLKKMNIRINAFGEIVKEYDVEDINAFLNEKVQDKKLNDDKA
jgi:hypothetical protein